MTSVILTRKKLIEQIELELTRLNIVGEAPIKLDITDHMLVVTPVTASAPVQDPEFLSALEKTKSRYAQALRNLAK